MSKKKKQLLNITDFCREMVCSHADAKKWITEGMPVHNGKFDLKECQRWHRIGYWEQRNGGAVNV